MRQHVQQKHAFQRSTLPKIAPHTLRQRMTTVDWMVTVLPPCRRRSTAVGRCNCDHCNYQLLSVWLRAARSCLLNSCTFDILSACGGPELCPLLNATNHVNRILHDYPLELVATGNGDALALVTVPSRQARRPNDSGGPEGIAAALAFAVLRSHRCVREFSIDIDGASCLCNELLLAVASSPGITELRVRVLGSTEDEPTLTLPPLIRRLYLYCMWVRTILQSSTSIDQLSDLTCDLNGLDENTSTALMMKLQGAPLKKLSLRNNVLSPGSIHALACLVSMPQCALSSLVLWNCGLSNPMLQPLWNALAANSRIAVLDLSCNNQIGDEGVVQLCHTLSCGNQAIQQLFLANVGLRLSETYKVVAEMLAVCSSLKHLDLSENRIDDRGMAALAAGVAQSSSLGVILLKGVKGFGATGVAALANYALQCADSIKIELGRIKVNDQASTELRKIFIKNLSAWQCIDIFWDVQSVVDFASVLKQCGRLEELTVPAFRQPQELEEPANFLPRLEAAVEHLIETLTLTDNVRVLRVVNAGHVGNAEVLSNYLVRTRTLRKVKFTYGSLRGWNIPVFMEALSMNKSLVELDFGYVEVDSSCELATALLQNRTLESFVCYDFKVQEPGFSQMAALPLRLFRLEMGSHRAPYNSFALYECLRTNRRHLLDAATFVLGDATGDLPGDRRRAEAFERVSCRRELRSEIASRALLDEA